MAVPRVFDDLCTRRVLVTEFMEGLTLNEVLEHLDDAAWLVEHRVDRERLARQIMRNQVLQALRCGFFQADPHPANLILMDDGRLGYVDLGIVGELDEQTRRDIVDMALFMRDNLPLLQEVKAQQALSALTPQGVWIDGVVRQAYDMLRDLRSLSVLLRRAEEGELAVLADESPRTERVRNTRLRAAIWAARTLVLIWATVTLSGVALAGRVTGPVLGSLGIAFCAWRLYLALRRLAREISGSFAGGPSFPRTRDPGGGKGIYGLPLVRAAGL
jgi:hypothetical protein